MAFQVKKIFEKIWLDEQVKTLPSWQQNAYQSFVAMVANDENMYPCVPAQQGYLLNQLRFSFIGDPRKKNSAKELADCIREYGEIAHNAGKYTSLAVFIETPGEMLESFDVEDYRRVFWNTLNSVTAIDDTNWPDEIPTDPSHHAWEFCFDGDPYFVFCATPAHTRRKSRYFPSLLLAFQPRFVFTEINDSTVYGRKLKTLIRQRICDYDGIPGHPDLKWYGQEDNHEWKQYFLSDDDRSASKCPFLRMQQLPLPHLNNSSNSNHDNEK